MTARTERLGYRGLGPGSVALILCLALATGLVVLAFGEMAIVAVAGLFLFVMLVRRPVQGVYLTVLLLLLGGSAGLLSPVGVGVPVTAAKLVGGVTVAAWLTRAAVKKEAVRLPAPVLLALLFLGWMLLSIVFAPAPEVQWPEWVRTATIVGLFVVTVQVLDTREKLHTYTRLLAVCGLVMAVVALLQYVLPSLQVSGAESFEQLGAGTSAAFVDPEGVQTGAAVRVSGPAGHPTWLALTLLMLLPLNLYWYRTARHRWTRALVLLGTAAEVAALVLTFTRAALVVGVVLFVAVAAKRLLRLSAPRLAALALVLVLGLMLVPVQWRERVLDFGHYLTSESTTSRFELQHYAWEYFEENPLVGVGPGGFGIRLLDETGPAARMYQWLVTEAGWPPTSMGPHNLYLQIASETGVIGLVVMLAFLAYLMRRTTLAERALRENGDENGALLASCVWLSIFAFVIVAIFLHALQQKVWWIVAALACSIPAYAAVCLRDAKTPPERPRARAATAPAPVAEQP